MLSGKWRPLFLSLNVLKYFVQLMEHVEYYKDLVNISHGWGDLKLHLVRIQSEMGVKSIW